MNLFSKLKNSAFYWDLFFISSVVGIWPRFIEPRLLFSTQVKLKISKIPNVRITQISDLHFHEEMPDKFLKKIERKVNSEKPNFIFFTGDFICRSRLNDSARLKTFLNSLKPSHGKYAVLGNHDYESYVTINQEGDYDILEENKTPLNRGLKRFFKQQSLTARSTTRAKELASHKELTDLLLECGITILENSSTEAAVDRMNFNIVGLGEHMLEKARPAEAFSLCDPLLPTIVLVHNPDAIPKLADYPGNLILSGHTHGGQVNLPWIGNKVCLLENPAYKRGLFYENGKWIYVSRGLGGTTSLRFFSPPEITTFHLESHA